MRRLTSPLVATAIVVGSIIVAAILVSLAPEPKAVEAPPRHPYVTTSPAIAGAGPIPIRSGGTVRPSVEMQVAPEVGGRVVWVNPAFKSGGRVESAQTLFRIEDVSHLLRLREAESLLADQRVSLLEAEQEAALARVEHELFSGSDDAAMDASPLVLRQPQLKAAQAALRRDESRVADARRRLSRTEVKAPFNAFVREESIAEGQIVAANQVVGVLFGTDSVEVLAPLTDAEAALIPDLWFLRPEERHLRQGGERVFDGVCDFLESAFGRVAVDDEPQHAAGAVDFADPRTLGAGRERLDAGDSRFHVIERLGHVDAGFHLDEYRRHARSGH